MLRGSVASVRMLAASAALGSAIAVEPYWAAAGAPIARAESRRAASPPRKQKCRIAPLIANATLLQPCRSDVSAEPFLIGDELMVRLLIILAIEEARDIERLAAKARHRLAAVRFR